MKSSTPRDALSLSPNAITVLEKRYLVKDEAGKPVETGRGSVLARSADHRRGRPRRTARRTAPWKRWRRRSISLMAERLFMPNSPTLMNAGPPAGPALGLLRAAGGRRALQRQERHLRHPARHGAGAPVGRRHRLRLLPAPAQERHRPLAPWASRPGPVSFMSLFDASTDVVKQGGTRRGANMGILRVDHPDILEFITCKDDTTQDHQLQHLGRASPTPSWRRCEADEEYDLIHPKTGKVVGQLKAREVWEQIIHGAWKTGEPGVFFIDRPTTTTRCRTSAATRPRTPAASSRSCRTTSATSARSTSALFVEGRRTIDWDAPAAAWCTSRTHFLDNVIDANQYPLPEITDLAQRIRRIGLGVMGLADLFVRLGMPYDSDEARRRSAGRSRPSSTTRPRSSPSGWRGAAASSPSGSGASGGPDADLRARPEGRAHPPDAEAPQLQRHHRGADRHDLDHRRLHRGHRAALRGGVHAEPGRRADARRERGLRRDREGARAGTPRT